MTSRIVLVTGTDTGAGKTTVAALWLDALRRDGIDAAYWKPVETGVEPCDEAVWRAGADAGGDCGDVAATAGPQAPVYGGLRLPEPLAPAVAAARAHVDLNADDLAAHGRDLAARHELLLVEGAGGLSVELKAGVDFRALAHKLDAAVTLVVANRLGCLNHAVLSWEALAHAGLERAGWVLNETAPADPDDVARATNPAELGRLLGAPLAYVVFDARPPLTFNAPAE